MPRGSPESTPRGIAFVRMITEVMELCIVFIIAQERLRRKGCGGDCRFSDR